MGIKVLFMDDIFSAAFQNKLDHEQLQFDEMWVDSIVEELSKSNLGEEYSFQLVKNGEIKKWKKTIAAEKPDILLLDMYWPEEAMAEFQDRRRGMEISLNAVRAVRKAYPKLPIVCYTIKPNLEVINRAYEAGATVCLEKTPLAIPEAHTGLKWILFYLAREAKK